MRAVGTQGSCYTVFSFADNFNFIIIFAFAKKKKSYPIIYGKEF
jgi:hypothetical protein